MVYGRCGLAVNLGVDGELRWHIGMSHDIGHFPRTWKFLSCRTIASVTEPGIPNSPMGFRVLCVVFAQSWLAQLWDSRLPTVLDSQTQQFWLWLKYKFLQQIKFRTMLRQAENIQKHTSWTFPGNSWVANYWV